MPGQEDGSVWGSTLIEAGGGRIGKGVSEGEIWKESEQAHEQALQRQWGIQPPDLPVV